MTARRTDLALEAHDLWTDAKKRAPLGTQLREKTVSGFRVTEVRVESREAAEKLGKPVGTYLTLDISPYWQHGEGALANAAALLGCELAGLIASAGAGKNALVIGLGNAAMTSDAIGPETARHILVTRHLLQEKPFSSLAGVSVLTPGVLARTGVESAELVRGAVNAVRPDVVVAVDALASARLDRVCRTVQLSDAGIVPGSGVGNHRSALNRETLGVPVIALGVPTVADAASLALDLLEEAGVKELSPRALRGADVMVTPRDIDAQVRELGRLLGFGINLALQPRLDFAALRNLAD